MLKRLKKFSLLNLLKILPRQFIYFQTKYIKYKKLFKLFLLAKKDFKPSKELQEIDLDFKVNQVCFSPNFKFIAIAGVSKYISIFCIENMTFKKFGKENYRLSGQSDNINCIDISTCSEYLASTSQDCTTFIYCMNSTQKDYKKVIHKIKNKNYTSRNIVKFSSKLLVTSGIDSHLIFCSMEKTRLFERINIEPGYSDPIKKLCFSPDENLLAVNGGTSFSNIFINVYGVNEDMKDTFGLIIYSYQLGEISHIESLCFTPSGTHLLCSTNIIRVFEIKNINNYNKINFIEKTKKYGFNNNICHSNICISADGLDVGYAKNETVYTYLFENENKFRLLNVFSRHLKTITSLCFSPCGNFLASGSTDQTLIIYC